MGEVSQGRGKGCGVTFEQALRLAGLLPRDIVADGRWRRCATEDKPRKRNGAYKLAVDGRVGWWRNWATDDKLQTWSDDSAVIVRDMAREQRAREQERARRVAAMRAARDFWRFSRRMESLHPYLERKGLSTLGCSGLRVSGEVLVIPVLHGEWIVSVQTIAADGTKRFWPGAPVKGGCYVIDRPRAALTALCEGLATGLAIYQAVRHARVVVAFDAGNLVPVAHRLKPAGSVVICADNDHETEGRIGINPGLKKAREAAEVIGCGVAHPEGIDGSDFADALAEWERPHRAIERVVMKAARYVEAQPP